MKLTTRTKKFLINYAIEHILNDLERVIIDYFGFRQPRYLERKK